MNVIDAGRPNGATPSCGQPQSLIPLGTSVRELAISGSLLICASISIGILAQALELPVARLSNTLLDDIVNISAVLLAFAVPLGYTFLTSIGAHYQSFLVPVFFQRETAVRSSVPLLMTVLLSAMCIRAFFEQSISDNSFVQISVIAVSCLFIVELGLLLQILRLGLLYMQPSYLIARTHPDLPRHADLPDNDLAIYWVDRIQALGDILCAEANRRNDLFVLENLAILPQVTQQLVELNRIDSTKFDAVIASKEYQQRLQSISSSDEQWKLYSEEQHFRGLHVLFLVFRRLFNIAISRQSSDLKREIAYHFVALTKAIRAASSTKRLQNAAIRELRQMQMEALHENDVEAFYHVCDRLKDMIGQTEDLNEAAINLTTNGLYEIAKACIGTGRKQHFSVLFHSLIMQTAGFSWSTNLTEKIKGDIKKHFANLDADYNLIALLDWTSNRAQVAVDDSEVTYCWEKLASIQAIIKEKASSNQAVTKVVTEIDQLKNLLRDRYFRAQLMRLCADVGAYCWNFKRFDWIRILWDCHFKRNSSATWYGLDLLPQNLSEFFLLICASKHFFRGRRITATPEDTEKCVAEYMVALLSKLIQEGHLSDQESIIIPAYAHSNAERFGEGSLNTFSSGLDTFSLSSEETATLGLSSAKMRRVMSEQAPALLSDARRALIANSGTQLDLGPVSYNRIQQFWTDFKEAFLRGRMRYVLKQNGRYRDLTDYPGDLNVANLTQFAVGRVISQQAFSEDQWFEIERGSFWGRILSLEEDLEVLNQILPIAEELKPADLNHVGLTNTWVAISIDSALVHGAAKLDLYHSPTAKFPGHYGYLQSGTQIIPLVQLTESDDDNEIRLDREYKQFRTALQKDILLFDGARIGEFLQYATTTLTALTVEGTTVKIDDLRKNPDAIEKLLSDHAQSLVTTTLDDARKRLQESIHLEFQERFKFVLAGGAKAYRIKLPGIPKLF